ncbi:MAG: hypothetical protein PVH03_13190 [Chloroflexota bacterium]
MACFCHTDGLPHYHGRYPLPGNHRLDELNYELWQVFRRYVRPGLLGVDTNLLNQELLWEFKAVGLERVQIEGHLTLVSPGDARIPLADAVSYTLARHEINWDWLMNLQENHGDALAKAGFSQAEFEELMELKRVRDEYLRADPTRIREVMEVYTDALLIAQGTKPAANKTARG